MTGCHAEADLVRELGELAAQSELEDRRLACVLVQSPFTVAFSLSADSLINIFDSHTHGTDCGALIATGYITQQAEHVASFLAISLDP